MKRPPRLWQWVGWRMGLIAGGAVLSMALIMWVRYLCWQLEIDAKIPLHARTQFAASMAAPQGREGEIWAYISRYYSLDDIRPGISGADWWTIALLLSAALPLILVTGFLLLRPLSSRFIAIAKAARQVAGGNLDISLPISARMPLEVQRLAGDFNSMTRRLRLYEQEVQASSAVLAHELRTPLNAAMGRVRGMLDTVFPANPEQLGLVLHQLEHLNLLVDDLLLLSLAQAGQLPLQPSRFTLKALLDERITWFKPQLAAAARKVWVIGLPAEQIHADRKRIGQVFNILLDNYLRYAAAGGDLCIQCQATAQRLTLSFQDRGPGLSEQDVQRVFQRFWRQEPSRNRHAGGSGLGLSIAQAICTAHGGSIEAYQGVQGGLVIELSLPRG
ncbi:ATP-binding protein [Pseudomonas muyukensis]|uniref:histidine kinase n=1 Tax=Pseudomonas muyukensis TaxID=2842357 RepID=A0ABX8M3G2_9PSED|nr:ATP-binding protein [Pseudomonas muyukensis]QXH33697.1 HAMP domain-containing protein [Pseudomonas muyukensis]